MQYRLVSLEPPLDPFLVRRGVYRLILKLGAEVGFDGFGGDHFDGVAEAGREEDC